ncbi:MAG: phosphotransferase [Gammaproteobacteria bacterium]|jgi:protein-ribulosamine 3-kinase|nr:phosphotransferase [Gammaproteobacteria bacterium]
MSLQARIESAISLATGEQASFKDSRSVHGGCINNSRVVELEDGRLVFVKTNVNADQYPGMFATEFEALQMLAKPGVIQVPVPIIHATDFIVMHAFEESERKNNWPELIGRQLALLHQATKNSRFGFENDNYIGTTKQLNTWTDKWLVFWREQRLGYQLGLFASKTGKDDKLLSLGEKVMNNLDELLAEIDEAAVLLHGDLWAGNAAANEKGEPIIYDPASYYGHREAEIGMMRMFGGFGPVCEAAYNEVWPLEDGAEQRINLYRLYHELNHLNLFGNSYYQSCVSTMEHLV